MPRNFLASTAFFVLILSAAILAEPVTSDRLASGLLPSGDTRGEIIELDAEGGSFIAIFQPSGRDQSHGGIILLHDQGTSANSLELIRPLRLGLSQAGWDTLSLQLPSGPGDQIHAASQSRRAIILARLQAGLAWLKARKSLNQAIVAQGNSAGPALQFAAGKPPRELRALVLVSSLIEPDEADGLADALIRIRLPLLDIYAERDHGAVLDAAQARRDAAARRKDKKYSQVDIPGSVAGFFGLEESLLSRIRGWLAVNAKGDAIDTR
jgi:hypothetical protein